jgi:hypothetical protein
MKVFVVTLLLVAGAAANSAAQQSQTATAPAQQTEPAPNVLPEPLALSRAVDFASHLLRGDGTSPRDGFYPDFGDKKGIATPQSEMELVRQRLKRAAELDQKREH